MHHKDTSSRTSKDKDQSGKDTSTSSTEEKKTYTSCPFKAKTQKPINLAIQGGGAHGAFAWGVIDRLLEDDRLYIEGISGTSAGSMNAAVLAYGLLEGGAEGAREKLHQFWHDIAMTGQLYNPSRQLPWETFFYGPHNLSQCILPRIFEGITREFSPYQLNPFDFNPLKDVLLRNVDFERLQTCQVTKLFLSATNVRTGQVRVFKTDEITSDVVLASACLPFLFKAVEIEGEYYWDGGYTGNPSLFPFFYYVESPDIVIIHINPIERPAPPTMPDEILNRINEISFNSALLKEFRAIKFVHKLVDEGWIKDEFKSKLKYMYLHSVSADAALSDLSVASKLSSDWDFLLMLRNRGRAKANEWLSRHYNKIGVQSSFNLTVELMSSRKKTEEEPKDTEETVERF